MRGSGDWFLSSNPVRAGPVGINLWIRKPPTVGCCCCCCCCCSGWWADCPFAAWGERQLWVLARVLPSIREATLSYPLAIFTNSVCMPQRKGLWEEEACSWSSMHGRFTGLFITASPLAGLLLLPAPELPLSQQLLMASEQLAPRQGNGASRTGPKVYTGTLGGHS